MTLANTSERTPLADSSVSQNEDPKSYMIRTMCYALAMIFLSVGLINFNNYMMDKNRFPYAVPLVLFHAVFCSVAAGLLRLAVPSFFPSLTDPAKKVSLDLSFILSGPFPIAIVFSLSLVMTNMAYGHLSVAFLQMMKESNLVFVYLLSLLLGTEAFKGRQACIIVCIFGATVVTIEGEMHFNLVGFCIQGTAILSECARIVMQGFVLNGEGRKLDPLSYVLVVMPLCAIILGTTLVIITATRAPSRTEGGQLDLPSMATLTSWGPLLCLNACVAFMLNVSIAVLIKHTSAVGYLLCHIIKDILAVLSSVFLIHESITALQACGFMFQTLFIFSWSMMKTFPEKFEEHSFAQGLVSSLRSVTEKATGMSQSNKQSYKSADWSIKKTNEARFDNKDAQEHQKLKEQP